MHYYYYYYYYYCCFFCGLEVPKSLNFMGAPNYYKHK